MLADKSKIVQQNKIKTSATAHFCSQTTATDESKLAELCDQSLFLKRITTAQKYFPLNT